MEAKYGAFFTNFKEIIGQMVELIEKFYKTLTKFVDGFKKNITASDDDFTY